ncbi:MAG: hypothetical protein ABIS14_02445 [Sphingomonas sp.]
MAATLIILAVEILSEWLYPLVTDLDADDPAVMAALIAAMPVPAKLLVVFGWFAGTFGGAWLALRVCDWRPAAWLVVGATIAGGIVNLFQFPHPLWMQTATIVAPLAGGWLALRLHRKPYPGEPLLG